MEERKQDVELSEQAKQPSRQRTLFRMCRRILTRKALGRVGRILRKCALPCGALALVALLLLFCVAPVFSVAICDRVDDRIVTAEQLADIQADCILVLGCAVYEDGRLSPMLEDRIITCAELYHASVSTTVVMSGEGGSSMEYDEVLPMKNAAMALGVEEADIQLDPDGDSTYDSILNLMRKRGACRVIIVSQAFHVHRAVYLAEKMGFDAYGVSADRQEYKDEMFLRLREIFARCKDMVMAEIGSHDK